MDDPAPLSAEEQEQVSALFAGDPPPAPASVDATLRRLRWLIGLSLPLNALGVLCWTGVPGAALTLWAWLLADAEATRAAAGAFSAEDADRVVRYRSYAAWNLGFCVVSLIGQALLMATPLYETMLSRFVSLVQPP